MRKIEIVSHDPTWADRATTEAAQIMHALGTSILAIHHIGSTAIPGIMAKPTLDLLAEVLNLNDIDELNPRMEALGYAPRGENGIPGRRYFVKFAGEMHFCHVHMFLTGNPEIARHINFRDYLIAHPVEAEAYSCLKAALAAQFPYDSVAYTDGKEQFVREIDRKASRWRSS